MQELSARQVRINDSFWSPRLNVNTTKVSWGGGAVIHGRATAGTPLNLIHYFLWANRSEFPMTVRAGCKLNIG